jgi:transcriptional regulator with XRE-family HTH domain
MTLLPIISGMSERTNNLGQVLKRHSIKQREMARAIGVSPETAWRWVSGRNIPHGQRLVDLVRFLKTYESAIEAADLFDGSAR